MLLINFYIYYENKKLIYNEVGIMKVTNVDELMLRLEKVRAAQKEFSKFSQEQVDEIFRQAAVAANNERIRLAKMAVEETGRGIYEDKIGCFLTNTAAIVPTSVNFFISQTPPI